MHSIAR